MDDLIKALQILRKYGNPEWPTHCEHDKLTVCIDPKLVSEADLAELANLGFYPDNEYNPDTDEYDSSADSFCSYKFGSA